MALAKETLCPTIAEVAFVKKVPSDDGKSVIFYFQSNEYIAEYNLEIPVSQLLGSLSEAQLLDFQGNIKFTIPGDQSGEPQYQGLKRVKPYAETQETYVISFGFSPQVIAGSNVKYAKTKIIKVYENWGELFKELKESGKLTANRTPATTAS